MPMKKGRGVSWKDMKWHTAADKSTELQKQGQGPWRRRQQLVDGAQVVRRSAQGQRAVRETVQ